MVCNCQNKLNKDKEESNNKSNKAISMMSGKSPPSDVECQKTEFRGGHLKINKIIKKAAKITNNDLYCCNKKFKVICTDPTHPIHSSNHLVQVISSNHQHVLNVTQTHLYQCQFA